MTRVCPLDGCGMSIEEGFTPLGERLLRARMSVLARLRFWLGRRLLRPHVVKLLNHYTDAARRHHEGGDTLRARNCEYIAIGLRHAIEHKGWPL